jgi:F420-dependent oxidoreductase-like protein
MLSEQTVPYNSTIVGRARDPLTEWLRADPPVSGWGRQLRPVREETGVRFALMLEPQLGLSYDDQLGVALRAEGVGFEAWFRSDHYQSFPGSDRQPTTDAWAVIAGLARDTTRIRLGALVSPVTFRVPGEFAKVVTTIDHMSGGRVDVGLGTGWHASEHGRYGFPFPPIDTRAEMLEEQLAIVKGFWMEPDGWRYDGKHYQIRDSVFMPKPLQKPHPPIIVGGSGSPRSIRIAARYADEVNMLDTTAAEFARRTEQTDDACRQIGRDPSTVGRSAMVRVMIGADESQLRRRTAAMLATIASDESVDDWLASNRASSIVGTFDEARSRCQEYAAAGCERIMLQDHLASDLEMIDDMGRELVGRI